MTENMTGKKTRRRPATLAAIENATGIVPAALPATPERLLADLEAGATVENLSGDEGKDE